MKRFLLIPLFLPLTAFAGLDRAETTSIQQVHVPFCYDLKSRKISVGTVLDLDGTTYNQRNVCCFDTESRTTYWAKHSKNKVVDSCAASRPRQMK